VSLDAKALQQAFNDHDRDVHGATEVIPIPECIADVKQRYDTIVPDPKLPADAAERIAEMLWMRGIGSRGGNKIAAEDIVGWVKNQLRGGTPT